MRGALTVIVAAAAMAALAGTASSSRSDVWHRLRRPLHIPHIRPGAPCPSSSADHSFDFLAHGVSQGYRPGPAYPIFPGAPQTASLEFDYPSPYGGRWSGQKVLWFLRPGFGERVLVRGRQLDGPYRVRFGELPPPFLPADELRLTVGGSPSTTRLRTGGCYGYQIDGPSYSRVIVFQAKLNCLAARVQEDAVRAGPFTGRISPRYDVVDGRFRLHVGLYRDRATGLSQKIPWFLSSSVRGGGSLVVRGQRLAPPRGSFSQTFQRAFVAKTDQQVYPSALAPPRAGCWRLNFRTAAVKASLIVRVAG